MKKTSLLVALLAACVLASGCATRIKVTSEPPGAMVRLRGEGRAAFRWMTGPTVTPCEMDVYYGRVSTYVIWPEGEQVTKGKISGVKSEKKQINTSFWRDEESVHFVKP
jgi:hypothetical protein